MSKMLKILNKVQGKLASDHHSADDPFPTNTMYQHKRQGSLRNLSYFGNANSIDFHTPPLTRKDRSGESTTTRYMSALNPYGTASRRPKQQYGLMSDSKKYTSCENVSRVGGSEKFLKSLMIDHDVEDDDDEEDSNRGDEDVYDTNKLKSKFSKRYISVTNLFMKSFRNARKKRRESILNNSGQNRLATNFEEDSNALEQETRASNGDSSSLFYQPVERSHTFQSINSKSRSFGGGDNDRKEDLMNESHESMPVFIGAKMISNEFFDFKSTSVDKERQNLMSSSQPSNSISVAQNNNLSNKDSAKKYDDIMRVIEPTAREPPPRPISTFRLEIESDNKDKKDYEKEITKLIDSMSLVKPVPMQTAKPPAATINSDLNRTILSSINEAGSLLRGQPKNELQTKPSPTIPNSHLKPIAPKLPKNLIEKSDSNGSNTTETSSGQSSAKGISRSKTFTQHVKDMLTERKKSVPDSPPQSHRPPNTMEQSLNELRAAFSSLELKERKVDSSDNKSMQSSIYNTHFSTTTSSLLGSSNNENTVIMNGEGREYIEQLKMVNSEISNSLLLSKFTERLTTINNNHSTNEDGTLLEKFSLSSSPSSSFSSSSASRLFKRNKQQQQTPPPPTPPQYSESDLNELVKVLGRQSDQFKKKFFDCLMTKLWDAKLPYNEYIQLNRLMSALFGENYHKIANTNTSPTSTSHETRLNAEHIVGLMRMYLDSSSSSGNQVNSGKNSSNMMSDVTSNSEDPQDFRFNSIASLIGMLKRKQESESNEKILLSKYMSVPVNGQHETSHSNSFLSNSFLNEATTAAPKYSLKLTLDQEPMINPNIYATSVKMATKAESNSSMMNGKKVIKEDTITKSQVMNLIKNGLENDKNSKIVVLKGTRTLNEIRDDKSELNSGSFDLNKINKLQMHSGQSTLPKLVKKNINELYGNNLTLRRKNTSSNLPVQQAKVITTNFQPAPLSYTANKKSNPTLNKSSNPTLNKNVLSSTRPSVQHSATLGSSNPPKPRVIAKIVKAGRDNNSLTESIPQHHKTLQVKNVRDFFKNDDMPTSSPVLVSSSHAESNYIDFNRLKKFEILNSSSTNSACKANSGSIKYEPQKIRSLMPEKPNSATPVNSSSPNLKPLNLKTLSSQMNSNKVSSPMPVAKLVGSLNTNHKMQSVNTLNYKPVGTMNIKSNSLNKNAEAKTTTTTVTLDGNVGIKKIAPASAMPSMEKLHQTLHYTTFSRYQQMKGMVPNPSCFKQQQQQSVSNNYCSSQKVNYIKTDQRCNYY